MVSHQGGKPTASMGLSMRRAGWPECPTWRGARHGLRGTIGDKAQHRDAFRAEADAFDRGSQAFATLGQPLFDQGRVSASRQCAHVHSPQKSSRTARNSRPERTFRSVNLPTPRGP